jgi:Enoyl-(Acyl carrier protein) reductase
MTSKDAVTAALAAAVDRFGGVDIVVSSAGIASGAPIEETSLEEWNRNHAIPGTGYFLVGREAFKVLRPQGPRRLARLRRVRERARGRRERECVLVRHGGRAVPRALPGRGGRQRRHPRQHRQPRRRPVRLAHGGPDSPWRKERADAYGVAPDELEGHYRKRTTLDVNIESEDIARAVLHFAPGAVGKRTPGGQEADASARP